ncbi:hypothetical protein TWF730_007463 [Orbilia blumenaviensis]|uniref:Uncharacterized protein n=1 Tax=Orbilia blumenaviensis TaxID=1796055 RepID=A0AAV9V912_9PEZI
MVSRRNFPTTLVFFIISAHFTMAQNQNFIGGWAARTADSCLDGEVDCGTRFNPFHACCPQGSFCRNPVSIPGLEDNTACCPTAQDCSLDLVDYNVCADDTWSLYNNTGFPFCCVQGSRGGRTRQESYSTCRPFNIAFPNTEILLRQETPDSRGTTSSSTSSTTSPTGTSSSVPPDPSSSNSDPNQNASSGLATAAIAGIAVGCVALLFSVALGIWFFRRRNQRRYYEEKGSHDQLHEIGGIQVSELRNNHQGYFDQSPQPMYAELSPETARPSQTPQSGYPNQTLPVYPIQNNADKGHPNGVSELSG